MELVNDILRMSPPVLLASVLLLVGRALKASPVQDWLIPFILIGLGALINIFIGDASTAPYDMRHVQVFLALQGVMIAGMAVTAHAGWRQLMNRSRTQTGDTEFVRRKPKTKPTTP